MKNTALIFILLFLGTTFAASGQTVGENTVVIRGNFTPSIKDARKVNIQPKVEDTVYQNPHFTYTISSKPLSSHFEVLPLKAAKMKGEPLDKLYHTYVALGMGTKATPYFELLHNSTRSRDKRYGFGIKHFSSAGSIRDYIYPGMSDNKAFGYYTKMWRKNKLDIRAGYTRTARHYYGVDTRDSLLILNQDLSDQANFQAFNLVNAGLKFSKYKPARREWDYAAALDYYFLSDKYYSIEHGVQYQGALSKDVDLIRDFKQQELGLNTTFRLYATADSLRSKTPFMIDVQPFYAFNKGRMKVKAGITANVSKDSLSEIKFFPLLQINYEAIEHILNLSFGLNGQADYNTYRALSEENPFVNNTINRELSYNTLSSYFKLGVSVSRNFNIDFRLNYEKWKHAPFYVIIPAVHLQNKFDAVYDDYNMVKVCFDAAYHKNEKLNIIFQANYYVYNTFNELFAWHRPEYDLHLDATYRLADKIRLNAALAFIGPSKAPNYASNTITAYTIPAWVDLSLGIEYRYQQRLGIFINLNNLAAQNYYRWYNYPSYGFNLLGGLNYYF